MEKNKPHCPLSRVKALIEAGKVHMTTTARNGAAALGYDRKRAYAEIMP
ncbi:MAG: type II toxin-antitoxin system MqsR family toxin [Bilophila wadsworthia]